ncbi:cytidine deaminase [Murdochiella vaginalis]|uniref:cytidine deaminase n=1 Tax=Murdochiella vaginalis TaxID=1852373 RepID=UPI0008FE1941|nr:cytidine deaminase [Murdochiella vaginalis]
MQKWTRQNCPQKALVDAAEDALEYAYSPYSHFQVGAALLDDHGVIWSGCNIENAAFSPGTCAERTALYKAVSEGVRSFQAIAIVGRQEGEQTLTASFTTPCGVCRQVLSEFCAKKMPVYVANGADDVVEYTLNELLPHSFGPEDLS